MNVRWYCPWCEALNRHDYPFCTTCEKPVTLVFDLAQARERAAKRRRKGRNG